MNQQTVEPKPTREVIDQVFLSPRVLDKAAFEEFAGVLKQLIEQVSQGTKQLQAAATQAEQVRRQLSETAPLLETRLTGATEAIRGIDSRTAEVRSALAKATDCAIRAESAEANVQRAARESLAQLESRLTSASESGKAYLNTLKTNVEENAREVAEAALRAIEAAGARLRDIETETATRLAAIAEQASRAVSGAEGRLNQLSDRIASVAGAGMSGIEQLCERATALLGYDPEQGVREPLPGSLTHALREAHHAEEVLAESCEQSLVIARVPRVSIDPTEPCPASGDDPIQARPARKRAAGRTARSAKTRPAKRSASKAKARRR